MCHPRPGAQRRPGAGRPPAACRVHQGHGLRACALREIALDTPTPENARRLLFQLTQEPHVAGTPAEKKVAEYVRDRFKEFGLDVEVVRYDVFLNHPKHVALKLIEPREEPLALIEDA